MHKIILLCIILISCGKIEDPLPEARSPYAPNRIPTRWSLAFLQESLLEVYLSEDLLPYLDAEDDQGHNLVEQMALNWNQGHPKLDFFALPFLRGENLEYENLKSYLSDQENGIYKHDLWFENLSSKALAVTQFDGLKRNPGTNSEYLEIFNADIVLNFRHFQYENPSKTDEFDLITIIFHEMGHFLGLPHPPSNIKEALMAAYLEKGEQKRALFKSDIAALLKLYSETSTSVPKTIDFSPRDITESPDYEVHVIELLDNRQINHYLNGNLISAKKQTH